MERRKSPACARCGRPALGHWVRPGIGSMYCEPKGSEDKYDPGEPPPDGEHIAAVLTKVLGALSVRELDQ